MINFFILSTPEYMPRTKVCVDSIRKYHPESKIYLEKYSAPITGNYPSGLAKVRFTRILQLLKKDPDQDILMLGADCVLYSELDSLQHEIISRDPNIILVPHRVTPAIPQKAGGFYRTGHACGDMVVFNGKSIPILEWLLQQDYSNNPAEGLFYEQTHLSSIPFLFDDVYIFRDKSYNVCYYNLDERDITNKSIVHFSGYVQGKPEKISKYYDGPDATGDVLKVYKEYDDAVARQILAT